MHFGYIYKKKFGLLFADLPHDWAVFEACLRHGSGMFYSRIRGFSFGQRQTDYIIQMTTISEWTRSGVPNLFSAAYHQIYKTNFHVPLNEQKKFLCTTIVKPIGKEAYFLVKKCISNFLSTTWSLSVYHQWYPYHRLGTPAL